MILRTTYKNKEIEGVINDLVGNPFSFSESLRMGGKGCKRMIIEESCSYMDRYLNKVADINYANIELRPEGIIVLLNKGLENFSWVIPYRDLVLYKTDRLSVHAKGKYVCFKNGQLYKENKKFIRKMINLKSECQEKYLIPTYESTL